MGTLRNIIVTAGAVFMVASSVLAQSESTSIWFKEPAKQFFQSLLLGNGRIGAMVFGGVDEERIVINESSVWSGSKEDNDRDDAAVALPDIRKLLLEGKNSEAQALVMKHFTCKNQGSGHGNGANVPFGCYQILGNLHLKFSKSDAAVEQYERRLDLATAMATVSYKRDGIHYLRQHITSAPAEAFVSRISSDKPAAITFDLTMDRPERFVTTITAPNELLITGTLNDGRGGSGVTYAARVRVINTGGTVISADKSLKISGADEVLILVTAATDYRGFAGRQLTDPLAATTQDLNKIAGQSFEALRKAQQQDHEKWFNRASLSIGDTQPNANSKLPTNERLAAFSKNNGVGDPELGALYFNMGRYLLISSSRPGGLPANLQGIWAEEIQTPWNGDWHLDINVQMNYWPAEVCNLSELHEPMFKLIGSLVEPGEKSAKAYYNARGWVAHVITNPWGFTAPGEHASWGATTSGSAWLCQHLWEHYAFTGDKKFLESVYPILKGSAIFYSDILIEEPKHKWLVTAPSNSPENTFTLPDGKNAQVCMGPTIDMQLCRELFGNTIRAAEILGVDADLRKELADKRARLAPNQIGPDGRLQEWLEPYPEPEPTHRHTSPMYGLYPYYEITTTGTPELAEACRKFLIARGDRSTGWALAWRISLWARLEESERAYHSFVMLMNPIVSTQTHMDGHNSGTYDNLLCGHPPFQIDGSFGGCAAIAEMLLQSQTDTIQLLPALPKAWPTGKVTGLRARGGFTVDIEWKDSKVTSYRIASDAAKQVKVRVNGEVKTVQTSAL